MDFMESKQHFGAAKTLFSRHNSVFLLQKHFQKLISMLSCSLLKIQI